MNKKDLKWYQTPAVELINVDVEGQLLAGSTNADNADMEGGEIGGDL